MSKIDKALVEVRRWKREISRKTLKMSTKEVIEYFNSVYSDPKIAHILKFANKG